MSDSQQTAPQKPRPTFRQRPAGPERFLKFHRQWAQEIANQTGVSTDLYRDPAGTPALTLEGWPRQGEYMATFDPERDRTRVRTRGEAVPAQAPATDVAEAKAGA